MFNKVFSLAFVTCGLLAIVQAARTVKECEKQMPASLKRQLCEVRQYKILGGQDMDRHMDCVMKTLGFVRPDGTGDYHKLIKPLNAIEKDRKHDFNLETCGGKTMRLPVGERANAYYTCLLNSSSAESFKKVFDLTELVKAGKLPALAQYGAQVEKLMKKIDAKICK
ncbi:37 kDa salivary gland allergen Aed a 2-like [Anopheles marshallii]|uniref:37 kDa salivary gland allergen Aed a 2-like n=1 Tax=Anopheles marshallii TaxID=1521116 RepID=UPI00237BC8FF|nr:37 kDa salivary gland allergen Aed a 2-like [Anopheles marshallii]